MAKRAILAMLGLMAVMALAAPSKARAQVFVGVHVGPVVPRPGYVVVPPRPAYVVVSPRPYPIVSYPRPYGFVPAYVGPVPGYYYRGRWCPRAYVYRGYVAPPYFRR
ncbi:MAG TPA: hypothetical protein VEG30_11400 [Terriglobales bacterium]|nr:hypothetical protein [Terriglobales bacterium]